MRRRILRRDPTCRLCNTVEATEVDHIAGRDNHHPDNLQGLCHDCHARKTQLEATDGTKTYWKLRQRKRDPEPHPGVITHDN